MKDYKKDLSPVAAYALLLFSAISYFQVGDFRKALSLMNRIKNEIKIEVLPDTTSFEKIFYILIHYELENFDLLPYLIKSAYRFIVKMEKLDGFQKIFFGFFRKLLARHTISKSELKNLFIGLKKELEKTQKDSLVFRSKEEFDYVSWIESKIENKSFPEAIKEKVEIAEKKSSKFHSND